MAILVEDKMFSFYKPGAYTPAFVRPAHFGYECPVCSQLILGLIGIKQGQKAPAEFRLKKEDEHFIRLKGCYPPKSSYMMIEPPSFESELLLSPAGEMGQLFWEENHFGQFESATVGKCRVSLAFRVLGEQPLIEVLRRIGLAGNFKSADELKKYEKVFSEVPYDSPDFVGNAWTKLAGQRFVESHELVKNPLYRQKLILVSREDWYDGDYKTLVENLLNRADELGIIPNSL